MVNRLLTNSNVFFGRDRHALQFGVLETESGLSAEQNLVHNGRRAVDPKVIALTNSLPPGKPGDEVLSPRQVAKLLNLSLDELATAIGISYETLAEGPQSSQVQTFLCNTLRVLNAARGISSESELPTAWLLNEPLAAFKHKTAFELIQAGRTEDVLRYLNSFSSGFVG